MVNQDNSLISFRMKEEERGFGVVVVVVVTIFCFLFLVPKPLLLDLFRRVTSVKVHSEKQTAYTYGCVNTDPQTETGRIRRSDRRQLCRLAKQSLESCLCI